MEQALAQDVPAVEPLVQKAEREREVGGHAEKDTGRRPGGFGRIRSPGSFGRSAFASTARAVGALPGPGKRVYLPPFRGQTQPPDRPRGPAPAGDAPMRFHLVDRVHAWEPGKRLTASKVLTLGEEYLADHFPTFPVMPGVLMLQAVAEAAPGCGG